MAVRVASGSVHVVVMGVSATGKSTVGRALAGRLGLRYVEGDDHHPPENIAKMSAGVPLSDADRMPWLHALAGLLREHAAAGAPVVLTCSALRRSYRDVLRSAVPGDPPYFVHLHAEFDVLRARMASRPGHFMPTHLLQSQFEALEPLGEDEPGVVIDVAEPLDAVVARAVRAVSR